MGVGADFARLCEELMGTHSARNSVGCALYSCQPVAQACAVLCMIWPSDANRFGLLLSCASRSCCWR